MDAWRPSTELCTLFQYYASVEHVPQQCRGSPEVQYAQDRVNSLFSRDYLISLIDNQLCSTYPLQIILAQRNVTLEGIESTSNEPTSPRSEVPVILFGDRNICRSAGLAEKAELVVRKAMRRSLNQRGINASKTLSRQTDLLWLKMLRVGHIFDLMNERVVSLPVIGVRLASSEITQDYYSELDTSGLPFPELPLPGGKLRPKELTGGNAPLLSLAVPFECLPPHDWADYMHWNVVTTLQQYIRYTFHVLRSKPNEGLLVHCISGWDRTPLFIGILRILLWAEGLVHPSLNADQILYLVVAYDFMLFGHQLASRLKEGCEIFYFAFWVLQHLRSSEYSYGLQKLFKKPSNQQSSSKRSTQRKSDSSHKSSSMRSSKSLENVHGEQKEKRKSQKFKALSASESFKSRSHRSTSHHANRVKSGDLSATMSMDALLQLDALLNQDEPMGVAEGSISDQTRQEKVDSEIVEELAADFSVDDLASSLRPSETQEKEELVVDEREIPKTIKLEKPPELVQNEEQEKDDAEVKRPPIVEDSKERYRMRSSAEPVKIEETIELSPPLSGLVEFQTAADEAPPRPSAPLPLGPSTAMKRRVRKERLMEVWEKFAVLYGSFVTPVFKKLNKS